MGLKNFNANNVGHKISSCFERAKSISALHDNYYSNEISLVSTRPVSGNSGCRFNRLKKSIEKSNEFSNEKSNEIFSTGKTPKIGS